MVLRSKGEGWCLRALEELTITKTTTKTITNTITNTRAKKITKTKGQDGTAVRGRGMEPQGARRIDL